MGPIATALKHFIAAGVSGDNLVRAIADIESAAPRAADESAERRRAKDRERKRAAREKEAPPAPPKPASGGSSESADVRGNPRKSAELSVSGEYLPPDGFDYGLSDASTHDERDRAARDLRNRTSELFAICQKRLNGCGDFTRPAMHDLSPLIRIVAPAKGKPCDWQLDVDPAFDIAVAQKHQDGTKVISLEYIVPIALRNRDKRLAGNPEPEKTNGRPSSASSGRPAAVRERTAPDRFDRVFGELERRATGADDFQHTGEPRRIGAGG